MPLPMIINQKNVSQCKAMLCVGALLFGLLAAATNVAGQEEPQPTDGGAAAVVEANRLKQLPPTASATRDDDSIKNDLEDKLTQAGIETAWDDTKKRYGGVAVFTFRGGDNIDLESYFTFRQTAFLGAMLTAQINLARWLGTKASMEVCLNDPGNPMFLEEVNAQAKKEVEAKIAELAREAEVVGAKASGDLELTTSDRFKAATDALIKKLDKSYDPQKSTEEKKKKLTELKQKSDSIQSSIAELEKKLTELQNAYSKAVEAGIALNYDHVIFGLSALAWGENLSPNGTLTVGLAYVWSPKLAKSVHAALTGEPALDADNVKGEESVGNWIKKQDLTSIGAFRYYVDNKGDRWFIGTGFAPNSLDRADQYAELQALQSLYMPLYSRLRGAQQHKIKVRAGTRETDLPAKAAQTLIENFISSAQMNTRGADQIAARDIKWPARIVKTGSAGSASVAVAVYALNAKSAAAALSANVQQTLAAAAVEHEINRRRLEQNQLLGIVDKAKTETPASRVPGLVNKTEPQSQKPEPTAAPTHSKTNSSGKLSPQPGKRVTPGKIKDDF